MDKLLKSLAFGIVLCGIVFGFVVGSRIDQSTITLLSGTLVGIAVAAPCVAVITWLVVRRKDDEWRVRERMLRQSAPLPPEPPAYWVVQAPPNAGVIGSPGAPSNPYALANPYTTSMMPASGMPRPRRRFYVIGENGEPREVPDPAVGTGAGSEFDGDYPPAF
jgi:hypothetical protein